ncbi:spermidine synthase [Aliivibrio fischeri]|uniref:spermidine synthase n=2 Tax=Aliivibrio fischeri TaxID=668 RepID=UPI0007C59D23|nr:fused MFS/spermidine synthase [Aliivibrio fischeri]
MNTSSDSVLSELDAALSKKRTVLNVKSIKQKSLIYALTFISGFISLGYQYFWFKSLTVTVGADLYSSSIVIAGFFLGLGLGSLYFAKEKFNNLAYYKLEFCVLLSSFLCTFVAKSLWLYLNLSEWFGIWGLGVVGISFVIPAFFMGGTLLLLIRLLSRLGGDVQKGTIYGINLFGAMFGVFLSASVLLPVFGVTNSLYLLYILNALVVGVGFLSEIKAPLSLNTSHVRGKGLPRGDLIFLYALSGFCSLSYEISWLQLLNQIMPSRSINYSLVVTVMLGGLGLGSVLGGLLNIHKKNAYRNVLIVSSLSILSPLFLILFLSTSIEQNTTTFGFDLMSSFFEMINGGYEVPFTYWQLRILEVIKYLPLVMYTVFIPSVLFGSIFPLIMKTANQNNEALDTGVLLGLNTIAGVFATILTGFILIPSLGVVNSLKFIMWMGIVVITCLYLQVKDGEKKWFISISFFSCLIVQLILPTNKTHLLLLERFDSTSTQSLFFSEGKGHSISVFQENVGNDTFKRLFVRGESNTADSMPSLRYMRLQSFLPYFVHNSEPKEALVIGLGTGITAGAFIEVESIQNVDVFELLPNMVEVAHLFEESNYGVTRHDKINIVIGDGRLQLAKTPKLYDIITLEPPPPSSAGVNNLYSDDFYKLAKTKMNQDGVLAQWFPITTQSSEASRAILNTMKHNFKFVNVWFTERYEALIIGSDQPFKGMSYDVIQAKWNKNPKIITSLMEVGIDSPVDLVATYLGSINDFEDYLNNAALITDDNALLEVDQYNLFIDDVLLTYQSFMDIFDNSESISVPEQYQLDFEFQRKLQRLLLNDAIDKNELYEFKGDPYVDALINWSIK